MKRLKKLGLSCLSVMMSLTLTTTKVLGEECVCTQQCTEDHINENCLICNQEGADLTECRGQTADYDTETAETVSKESDTNAASAQSGDSVADTSTESMNESGDENSNASESSTDTTSVKTVTGWEYVDLSELDEGGTTLTLSATENEPCLMENVISFLPTEVTITLNDETTETISLTWLCSDYPSVGAYSGSYTFRASLPEGYSLAEKLTEPSIQVLFDSGDTVDNESETTDTSTTDYSWYYNNLNSDTFEISDAKQLLAFAKIINDHQYYDAQGNLIKINEFFANKTVKLTADIVYNELWDAIGYSDTNCFMGNFNGQGHTITLSNVTNTHNDYFGLFGYLYGNVENLTTEGSIKSTKANSSVGAIAGVARTNTFSNCVNNATITASGNNSNVGGIIGNLLVGTLTGCSNSGTITVSGSGTSYVGGLVGLMTGNGSSAKITKSFNTGSIDVTGCAETVYAGGIDGITDNSNVNKNVIDNCYNRGTVTGLKDTNSYIGGIAGYRNNYSSIVANTYNVGKITGSHAGSILGGGSSADAPDYEESNYNYSLNGTVDATTSFTMPSNYYTHVHETYATGEQFKSGEVAYGLNKSQSETVNFYQNIGTDSYPTVNGTSVVYCGYASCTDTTLSYSNKALPSQPGHQWEYKTSVDSTTGKAILTATCKNNETETATLTLSIANATMGEDGKATVTYQGSAYEATVSDWSDSSYSDLPKPSSVSYYVYEYDYWADSKYDYHKLSEAPMDAGQYKASITVGDQTLDYEYVIAQKVLTKDDFSFEYKEGISKTYNGKSTYTSGDEVTVKTDSLLGEDWREKVTVDGTAKFYTKNDSGEYVETSRPGTGLTFIFKPTSISNTNYTFKDGEASWITIDNASIVKGNRTFSVIGVNVTSSTSATLKCRLTAYTKGDTLAFAVTEDSNATIDQITDWQSTVIFENLKPNTTYYAFAKITPNEDGGYNEAVSEKYEFKTPGYSLELSDVTVTKSQSDTTSISDASKTYDGNKVSAIVPTLTRTDNNTVVQWGSISYDWYKDNLYGTSHAYSYLTSGLENGPKDAGNYRLTVTVTSGSTSISKSTDFTITKAGLTLAATNQTIEYGSDKPSYEYTVEGLVNGETAESVFAGKQLFTSSYVKGSDAGTYTIQFNSNINTNLTNYTLSNVTGGTLTVTKKAITESMVSLSQTSFTYDGTEKKPMVTVKDGDIVLEEGVDYNLVYVGNVYVGDHAYVKVSAISSGNFTGEVKVSFTINPRNLSDADYDVDEDDFLLGASPTVEVDGTQLQQGTDFTYSYNEGTDNAEVTILGMGNYTGSATGTVQLTNEKKNQKPVITNLQVSQNEILTHKKYKLNDLVGNIKDNATISFGMESEDDNLIGRIDKETDGAYFYLQEGKEYVSVGYTFNISMTIEETDSYNKYVAKDVISITVVDSSSIQIIGVGIEDYYANATPSTPVINNGIATDIQRELIFIRGETNTGTHYSKRWQTGSSASLESMMPTEAGSYHFVYFAYNSQNKLAYDGTCAFEVLPLDISNATVTLQNQLTYNGELQTQDVEVMLGSTNITNSCLISGDNAVDAGENALTIQAKDNTNYTGTINATYTVNKRALTDSIVSLENDTYLYTGQAIEPTVVMKEGLSAKDISVTYEDNINAGSGKVILTALESSNYSGSVTLPFTIQKASISDVQISLGQEQTFTGNAIEPKVTVYKDGKLFEDYSVTYSNNTYAGTAKVTVTGTGNYTGSQTTTFTILPADQIPLSTNRISVYTGNEYDLSKLVTNAKGDMVTFSIDDTRASLNGSTLTVMEETESDPVQVKVTVSEKDYLNDGKIEYNAYEGIIHVSAESSLKILDYDTLSISQESYTYGTDAPLYKITKPEGFEIKEDNVDYTYFSLAGYYGVTRSGEQITGAFEVTEAGTYYIYYFYSTPDIHYECISNIYQIYPKKLSTVSFSLGESLTYNETQQEQTITSTDENVFKDVTITGNKATNAGTYTLTIDASDYGNYTGTTTLQYTIAKKSITPNVTLEQTSYSYTGKPITPIVTVKDGDTVLQEGVDYTVSYENNTAVGNTGSVTVTAAENGNYTFEPVSTNFSISNMSIDNASLTAVSNQTYTGTAITPKPIVTLNKKVLKEGTDYTYSYFDNINVGEGTVTITGMGNYVGSVSKTFRIVDSLTNYTVSIDSDDLTYTGKVKEPSVTLTRDNSKQPLSSENYTISYNNHTNAGIANIIISGNDYYTGTITGKFVIEKASIVPIGVTTDETNQITCVQFSGLVNYESLTYDVDYTIKNESVVLLNTERANNYQLANESADISRLLKFSTSSSSEEGAPEITLGDTQNILNSIRSTLIPEYQEKIDNATAIHFSLKSSPVSEAAKEDQTLITSLAKNAGYSDTIYFFDLTASLTITDTNNKNESLTISDTGNPLSITITIPEDLKKVPEGYRREYVVYTRHKNNEATGVPSTYDSSTGKLTIQASLFSTYAIACKDVKITSSSTRTESTYDDGGPFTTDACGNVYDRWGNAIYTVKACNVKGYNLVDTGA